MNTTKKQVCVVGLGYIGLPTAVVLAQHGWEVTGVDISDRTVEYVSQGRLPFVENGLEDALEEVVFSGKLKVQKDMPASEIYIVSVPTPFKDNHEADLSFIDSALDAIIPQLKGNELVILESTSPPGTTEYMSQRVFQARPNFSVDGLNGRAKILFAHAPERVLPGRIMIELTANDRIIGGLTTEAAEAAKEVYLSFCRGKIYLTDAKTAEMTKLTENSFRDVNIAFANELSLICDDLGIDVWELISLANKHPRVNILNPGPGVGGHCIAVDPWFIVSADSKHSRLISTARRVNDSKPDWVVEQVEAAIQGSPEPVKEIAVFGLTFKPNIDDLRESPALRIAVDLAHQYPNLRFNVVEPNIEELPNAFDSLENVFLVDKEEATSQSQLGLILVAHSEFSGIGDRRNDFIALIDTVGLAR